MKNIARFFKDESGATAIEYGLLAALISVAAVVAFGAVGSQLTVVFEKIKTEMSVTE